ncbi:MAG: signal peptidase I [Candidatus Omnitrophota bacterium]
MSRVKSIKPVGMKLYGLLEEKISDKNKKYTFVNWDEKDSACLEMMGDAFQVWEKIWGFLPWKKSIVQKPKEPLLAIILSLCCDGLGQIYAGYPKKGILFFVLRVVCSNALAGYIFLPETKSNLFLIALLVSLFLFRLYIIVDAYFSSTKFNQLHDLESRFAGYNKKFLICGIVFAFIMPMVISLPVTMYVRKNIVQAYKIPAGSMSPTLLVGDRILVDKRIYKESAPQRGDLIVFIYPEDKRRDFIKRLIAFEGEKVEIKNDDIYINGELIMDPRIKSIDYYANGYYGQRPVTVPTGHYFVLGDNSAKSHDSRYWGFVPEENVKGKVFKIYWPPERSGLIE